MRWEITATREAINRAKDYPATTAKEPTVAVSKSEYSADELRQMLLNGAGFSGSPTLEAAVHLLTFTELPNRRAFAELLDVEALDQWADGRPILAAWVRDWATLPNSAVAAPLSGGDARMLALAVSLAAGEPVDLQANVGVGGHAHARRLIEAMAIATGYAEMYAVAPTPALDETLPHP